MQAFYLLCPSWLRSPSSGCSNAELEWDNLQFSGKKWNRALLHGSCQQIKSADSLPCPLVQRAPFRRGSKAKPPSTRQGVVDSPSSGWVQDYLIKRFRFCQALVSCAVLSCGQRVRSHAPAQEAFRAARLKLTVKALHFTSPILRSQSRLQVLGKDTFPKPHPKLMYYDVRTVVELVIV